MINKAEILSRYALRQVSPEEQQAFQEWMQTLDQQEFDAARCAEQDTSKFARNRAGTPAIKWRENEIH